MFPLGYKVLIFLHHNFEKELFVFMTVVLNQQLILVLFLPFQGNI